MYKYVICKIYSKAQINDKAEQNGATTLFTFSIFLSIATQMGSLTFVQMFLKGIGISVISIGLLGSGVFISTGLGFLVGALFSDHVKNKKRTMMNATATFMVLPIILCFIGINVNTLSHSTIIILTMIGIAVSGFAGAIRAVINPFITKKIISPNNFGTITGIIHTGASLISVLGGTFSIWLCRNMPFPTNYIVIFAISLVACAIGVMAIKNIDFTESNLPKKKNANLIKHFRSVITCKEFKYLLIPNILRGGLGGIMVSMTLYAANKFGDNGEISAYMVTAMVLASSLAGIIFSKYYKKWKVIKTLKIAYIVEFINLILFLFTKDFNMFIIIFVIAYIGEVCISLGIPVGVLEVVDKKIIASFTSLRLLLSIPLSAIMAYVCGVLIANNNSDSIIYIALSFIVVLYVSYVIGFGKIKKIVEA